MPLNSRSLKQLAWRSMRDAVPSAVLVTLVFILLSDVLSGVIGLFVAPITIEEMIYGRGAGTWMGLFLDVVLMLFTTVLTFGYHAWSLRVARGEETGIGTLMDGFGMVGSVLWMEVQIFLRVLGWGLVLGLGYVLLSMPTMILGWAGVVVLIILSVLFYMAVLCITMSYSLAPFLLYDYPEAGGGAAVRRSAAMMRGHYWQMIKLYLSFWKWFLADILVTFVVMGLMLVPMADQIGYLIETGSYSAIVYQLQIAMNSGLGIILSVALSLPLYLFFSPYLRISIANFYRALSQEPVVTGFTEESF